MAIDAHMEELQETDEVVPALDVRSLFAQAPPGNWMAVSQDRRTVIAFAPDAQAAFDEARQKGEARPIMLRHPEEIDFIY